MAFEVFKAKRRHKGASTITFVKGGTAAYLSKEAVTLMAADRCDWMVDRQAGRVGLRPAAQGEYKISKPRGQGEGGTVSCRLLLEAEGLQRLVGKQYPAKLEGQVLAVDIGGPW